MYGVKIINKEKVGNLDLMLKEELSRSSIDEFKCTALVEMGANGICLGPEKDVSGLVFAIKQKFYNFLSTVLIKCRDEDFSKIWEAYKLACQLQDEKAALIILSSSVISVSRKENNRMTALMVAASHGLIKVAKELLKRRANMHAIDANKKSVLDYAKESGYSDMVDLINHVIKKDNERIGKLSQKKLV